jgi:hypothetical protein
VTLYIRMMEYAGNDTRSFRVHRTYKAALAEAKEWAQQAGDIEEVSEHKDSVDGYEATIFCTAGVCHVIRAEFGRLPPIEPCEVCGQFVGYVYMVHDHVWAQAGLGPRNNAHIPCLEQLLRRGLVASDFTAKPCNEGVLWGLSH